MKKNYKYWALILLLLLILLLVACTTTKKVKNAQVKELINVIKKIEFVSKTDVFNLEPHVIINIYVEENFTEDNSLEILELAKEYFDEDTKNELMEELKKAYPLDIQIMIRDEEGNIIYSFLGSCYESYHRGIPPDFTQYEWSYWDSETQTRIT